MSKAEDSSNNFFVIEPIEMSSESEPEELEDLDDLNDIKHEEDNLFYIFSVLINIIQLNYLDRDKRIMDQIKS
ncbi:unnamed protein product [Paramecium sonneborni]|uniref:Uncharacterized protein n=1 Tax=Paramecium sonneborni TaxID=65129 RepID=A0A8S1R6X0_9CILI|nr:unnamed protein product [Paramecium sonneborni]